MDPDRSRARFVLFAVLTQLALAGPAWAGDAAQASRLLKKANAQCAGKQPEAALPIYEEAIKARSLPQIHMAYGECLRQLGRCDKALEQYRQYLKMVRSRKNRDQAQALIQLCENELKEKAAAPVKPTPAEQAPTGGEQPPDLRPASQQAVTAPPPVQSRRRLSPIYFWTGVGVTAALLATGTACGVVALQKSSTFKDPTTPDADLQGLKDSGEALKLTSTITFAVGGAAAIATTVLFFYTRFKPAETVSASPVPGGAVVVMGGRF